MMAGRPSKPAAPGYRLANKNRAPGSDVTVEEITIAKVTQRIVPFLMLCYFVAYLDRVNVGFAALEMNKALGLSSVAFGFGAGIFFFSYFVFEVPSNLALERFGARRWIARIMLSWGILSGAMACIPWLGRVTGLGNENAFYGVRILLGAAEAGFFPGIIFYLTLWFPAVYRARIVGYFMAAIPLSSVIGGPLSGLLLYLHGGLGLDGWQWLFIITRRALPRTGSASGRPWSIRACSAWRSCISARWRRITAPPTGCRRSSRRSA